MLGKNSGLGGKLRSLLAKFQREFHFPKVFSMRVALSTRVHNLIDKPNITIHEVDEPNPQVHHWEVDLTPPVSTGHVTQPEVHLSQTMESMATEAHDVVCWHRHTLEVRDVSLALTIPGIHTQETTTEVPEVLALNCEAAAPNIMTSGLLQPPGLHGHRSDAARFPYHLRMMPIKSLPMKMQIRYRAGVLKMLNLKPNQVDFIGVVLGLPSAPLKLIDVETDTLDGYPRVLAAQTGRFNSFMSGRVWVIIQMKGKPDYLSVIVREE